MGNATVSAATEAELVSRILQVVDRINAKTTQLQGSVDGKMHWLPPGLRDTVAAGWDRFCAALNGWWDFWYEVATHLGSPSKVSATADAWSDLVGNPVSAQVQSADAGMLAVDDNWDGDAANAYRQTLPLEKTALEKVKSALTDGISGALSDVARSIIIFWGTLIGALSALVVGIVGALASSATIFGLPAAPVIAAAAAAAAAAAVITGGMLLESACSSAATTMRQRLDDNAGFIGGHWPPAATY